MADVLTTAFFEDILTLYAGKELWVMLLTADAAETVGSNVQFVSEFTSFEVPAGFNYVTNGKILSNKTVLNKTLKADNVIWADSTITARFAVVYDKTQGLRTAQRVIGIFDFGSSKASLGGDFEISWSDLGIIKLS